jgi:uncharacterized protein
VIYFEWDEAKAARNLRVHGISFITATAVFEDPYCITEEDSVVDGELRLRTTGLVNGTTMVIVIHLQEVNHLDTFVRIISARKATPLETTLYDQNYP